jgi:hypothetical protein
VSWSELTRLGVELGLRGVQRWRADHREDLSDGAHRQSACAVDVRVVPRRLAVGHPLPNALVLRLTRADGWNHTRWAGPASTIRVTLRRETYVLVGLLLWVPPDPNPQQLLALGIRQLPFAQPAVDVMVTAERPTREGLRRADLLLPDGSVPFELPPVRRPGGRIAPAPAPVTVALPDVGGGSAARSTTVHRRRDGGDPSATVARLRAVDATGAARPMRAPSAALRPGESGVTSARCGARTKQGGTCRLPARRAGLCDNHLARAELGRKVIWHGTGGSVRLGRKDPATPMPADYTGAIGADNAQRRPEPLGDRDDLTPPESTRTRFVTEITRRGFRLGPGAKYVYYRSRDYSGTRARIVIRGTRIRLEKPNEKTYEYELWRSYRIADEVDLALREIDETRHFTS